MREERPRTSAWQATGRKVIRINQMIPKEKICFDLLTNSLDFYRKIIDVNRSHSFFLYRFPSIDIGNQHQSSINIDYYRYVWHAVLPTREQKAKLSKCPTTPRRNYTNR